MRGLAQFRKGGKADTGDKFAKGFFGNRGLETMRRAKALEHRLERLMNEDHVDKPKPGWELKIEFGETLTSGRDVLSLENLTVGYDGVPILRNLDGLIRLGQRVALIGPNGCGKTTILRTVCGKLPALNGSYRLGTNVRLGYMAQEQESLDANQNALTIIRELLCVSETDTRAFLSKYLFTGDDVFTPAGKLSYGERTRLMLASRWRRDVIF